MKHFAFFMFGVIMAANLSEFVQADQQVHLNPCSAAQYSSHPCGPAEAYSHPCDPADAYRPISSGIHNFFDYAHGVGYCGYRAGKWVLNTPWKENKPSWFDWGGHLEAGVYANEYGNTSETRQSKVGRYSYANGPLGVRGVTGVQLNQLWLWFGREADTRKSGFDFGWRLDMSYGTDHSRLKSTGSDHSTRSSMAGDPRQSYWDSDWSSGDYGLAIPQLYVEGSYRHYKLRAGHFFSPIGYESASAAKNDFYSQTYFSYNGAPTTLTGISLERALGEHWELYAGWANGWDTGFENRFNDSMLFGGIKWTPTRKTSLSYGFIGGKLERNKDNNLNRRVYDWSLHQAGDDTHRYLNNLTWVFHATKRLRLVTEGHYGFDTPNFGMEGRKPFQSKWYGIRQIAVYQLNEKWSLGGRFEWFSDDTGEEGGYGQRVQETWNTPMNYYALTFGASWKPCRSLVIRPEIRYDWTTGKSIVYNKLPTYTRASGNSDQLSGGFDVVYQF